MRKILVSFVVLGAVGLGAFGVSKWQEHQEQVAQQKHLELLQKTASGLVTCFATHASSKAKMQAADSFTNEDGGEPSMLLKNTSPELTYVVARWRCPDIYDPILYKVLEPELRFEIFRQIQEAPGVKENLNRRRAKAQSVAEAKAEQEREAETNRDRETRAWLLKP